MIPEGLASFGNLLVGNAARGEFVELRYKLPDRPGMGQEFFELPDGWITAVHRARQLATRGDVYLGVLPRLEPRGDRSALTPRAHMLWADVDGADALARLREFRPRPSCVVRSGSPDSVHAYWPLSEAVLPAEVERGNRRLAHSIGADMRSTDAPRILRLPETLNHKRQPPAPVELLALDFDCSSWTEIAGGLPDPPARRSAGRRPATRDVDELRTKDAALALIARFAPEAELSPSGSGRYHGRCPLPAHSDRHPSFCLFPDGGWVCSCGTGDVVRLYVELQGKVWQDRLLPTFKVEVAQLLGLSPRTFVRSAA